MKVYSDFISDELVDKTIDFMKEKVNFSKHDIRQFLYENMNKTT